MHSVAVHPSFTVAMDFVTVLDYIVISDHKHHCLADITLTNNTTSPNLHLHLNHP